MTPNPRTYTAAELLLLLLVVATCTLNNQFDRIERELGMTLLIRAWHERPMRLTDDGTRVVRAIWAHQHDAGHS